MNAYRLPIDDSRDRPPPGGFSLLEVMVAMVVLGIAFVGLFPLAVQHSRQVAKLEACNPQTGQWKCEDGEWTYHANSHYPNWYLNPSPDAWARKLGAAAVLSDDTVFGSPDPTPIYDANTKIVLTDNSSGVAYYGETDTLNWGNVPSFGYFNGCRRHEGGEDGSPASGEYAAWIFEDVPPGWYVVEATWPNPASGWVPQKEDVDEVATTSACFAVHDFATGILLNNAFVDGLQTSEAKAVVNQTTADGYWQPVMTVFVPSHRLDSGNTVTTVQVRLMSEAQSLLGIAAAGFTTADAVRLAPNSNIATATALTPTFGTTTVSAATSVDRLTPSP